MFLNFYCSYVVALGKMFVEKISEPENCCTRRDSTIQAVLQQKNHDLPLNFTASTSGMRKNEARNIKPTLPPSAAPKNGYFRGTPACQTTC